MWCSLRTASAADRRYGFIPYAAVNFCRNHLKRPDNPRRKKIPGSPPKKREWLLHSVFWGLAAKEYSVPVVCHSIYFWCIVGTYMFYGVGVIIISVRVGEKILASSILMITARLAAEFSDSFLSCLALLYFRIVKNIPEPFFTDLE